VRASQPIAWGCVRSLGAARESLLVTEEVRGISLPRALDDATPAVRRTLSRSVGDLIGRSHAAGIFHEVCGKDLIASPDGEPTLIDRDPKDALDS
jgi:tRNA A-37 threonylcarbamoyl transferase component Bud32